jgi:hypothetical protein
MGGPLSVFRSDSIASYDIKGAYIKTIAGGYFYEGPLGYIESSPIIYYGWADEPPQKKPPGGKTSPPEHGAPYPPGGRTPPEHQQGGSTRPPPQHGAPYPVGGRPPEHQQPTTRPLQNQRTTSTTTTTTHHPPPHALIVPPHIHPSEETQERNVITRGVIDEATPQDLTRIKDPLQRKLIATRQQQTPIIQKKLEEQEASEILGGARIRQTPINYKPAINDPNVKKIAQRYNVTPGEVVTKLTGGPETAAQMEQEGEDHPQWNHGKGVHGGHNWVTSGYPRKNADGMVTHVNVKDDYGPNILPKNTTSIFSVGYDSLYAKPEGGALRTRGNETEIIYLASGGGRQRDMDTDDPEFVQAVSDSRGNMAHQPVSNGIYATVDGKPVQRMKLPIVKGHDYTNVIRDLGNNQGTLYQVIDNTSGQQDSFIDKSWKGKNSGPAKKLMNFDEWHVLRSETDPNQDLGPVARRYDINVTSSPMYIVNNADPTKPGTLLDAGTPTVSVQSRVPMPYWEQPDFTTTRSQLVGANPPPQGPNAFGEYGWGYRKGWVLWDDGYYFFP